MKSECEIYKEYIKSQPDFLVIDYMDEKVQILIKSTTGFQGYLLKVRGWEFLESVRLSVYKLFK